MSDAFGTQRPAWLLSDFAGVLGLHQSSESQKQMASTAGADFDGFWDSYWAERPAYDAAEVSRDEYWKRIAARLGTSWPSSMVTTLDRLDVESWLRPDRETLRVAEDLRSAGVRLAVLSNAPVSLAAALHELPWLGAFERVVCSSEVRVAKPDPRCYMTALRILDTAPNRVVFVDDREVNVTGAQALGIQSLLFTDAARLRRDLLG